MHMAIPLCVPFAQKTNARAAGARWDQTERVWKCDPNLLNSSNYVALRPYLPRMYRKENDPPFIAPFMVPQTSWGKNLRSVLIADDWDRVRKLAL